MTSTLIDEFRKDKEKTMLTKFRQYQTQTTLIRYTDMSEEMSKEIMENIATFIDKSSVGGADVDIEAASKLIKDKMDKDYGAYWQCIIGEGFAYDINHQTKSILHCYVSGMFSVLLFKC